MRRLRKFLVAGALIITASFTAQDASAQDGTYYGPKRFACDYTGGDWVSNGEKPGFCLHNPVPRWVRRQCVQWVRIIWPSQTRRQARIACNLPVRSAAMGFAQGAPEVEQILRIYTGGWNADTNGDGDCGNDAQTTYVATQVPQGKFRHELQGRRLPSGRYDVTVIVWAVDHTGTEMTRWNYELHYPSAGRGEFYQGDQHYTIAWADSVRPDPGRHVTWFFRSKVHHIANGTQTTLYDDTCSVRVVAP